MLFASSASALALVVLVSTSVAQSTASCPFTPTFTACAGPVPSGVDCASVDVHRDWTRESDNDFITVRLVRRRANVPNVDDAPAIFVNPGGPGSSGIDAVVRAGLAYQSYTSANFSIIGYDPRGVGLNMPYQCVPTGRTQSGGGLDYRSTGFFTAAFSSSSETARLCNEQWGGDGSVRKIGRIISSAQTARDIREISRKVGDKKLRYWGFSYGTVLGATLARLYPDEITGMILDGNINPNDYYRNSGPPSEEGSDIDAAVRNFFRRCAEVPQGQNANQCAWTTPANQERTPESLLAKFSAWVGTDPFDQNRGRDATLPAPQNLSADQSYIVRNLLFEALRSPPNFAISARILQYWYDSKTRISTTPVGVDAAAATLPSAATRVKARQATDDAFDPAQATASPDASAPNALIGISCLDGQYRPTDLSAETYEQVYNAYSAVTIFGSEFSVLNTYACMSWVTQPKDRFGPIDNPFGVPFSTSPGRVMVIQTPFDVVTPLASGRAMSIALGGTFVTTDGAGHCSTQDLSNDLYFAIQRYWNIGVTNDAQYRVNKPNPFGTATATFPLPEAPTMAPVDNGDGTIEDSAAEPQPLSDSSETTSEESEAEATPAVERRDLAEPSIPEFPKELDYLPDYSYIFESGSSLNKRQDAEEPDFDPVELIGPDQPIAAQPTCADDDDDSTTSTSMTATATTMASSMTMSTTKVTPTMSTTFCPYGPWQTSPSYSKWNNQPDCTPITKTINGKAGIYAVPTKTTYIDYVDDLCETGRYSKTITITATCNKGCDSKPTGVPQGYTTSTVYCSVCATPSDVVVTYKQGEEWHAKSAAAAAADPAGKPAAANYVGGPTDAKPVAAGEAAGPAGKHVADASAAPTSGDAPAPAKPVDAAAAGPQWSDVSAAPGAPVPVKPAQGSPEGDGGAGGDGKVAGYTGGAVSGTVSHVGVVLAVVVGFWVS